MSDAKKQRERDRRAAAKRCRWRGCPTCGMALDQDAAGAAEKEARLLWERRKAVGCDEPFTFTQSCGRCGLVCLGVGKDMRAATPAELLDIHVRRPGAIEAVLAEGRRMTRAGLVTVATDGTGATRIV